MGFGSIWHWVILVLVIVLLFGGGRVSSLMGDVAKGIKSFKKGMTEDDEEDADGRPRSRIEAQKAADPAFDRDGEPIREDRRP